MQTLNASVLEFCDDASAHQIEYFLTLEESVMVFRDDESAQQIECILKVPEFEGKQCAIEKGLKGAGL